MIATNSSHYYYCASVDGPAPATLICHHAGCAAYPFLCGRTKCDCAALHRKHSLKMLGGLLEELAAPLKQPEELMKEDKDIDGFIGALIANLQNLRSRLQEKIKLEAKDARKYAGLVQKLIHGEQLESKEARGDIFNKMLIELEEIPETCSSYRVNGQSLKAELNDMRQIADALFESIQRLWSVQEIKISKPTSIAKLPKQTFRFSSALKHIHVEISEKSSKAVTSGLKYGLALLDPCLSTSDKSRITFKINKTGDDIGVGVCFKDTVAYNNYQRTGFEHGLYIMYNNSKVWSHCNTEDGQAIGFNFKQGDQVSVEMDPIAGKVTYSLVGKKQRFVQPFMLSHLKLGPLHFVVYLWSAKWGEASVTIIDA